MDEIVKQAMVKWPNVPDCYGWLGLDARGNWYMRDERAQRSGAFSSGQPGAKGAELRHEKLRAFIERNYACDARGCWYFQNGPQRVFVELELTPWVWRLLPTGETRSHTGTEQAVSAVLLDEHGHLYLHTPAGLGVVHAQDMWEASERMEKESWTPTTVLRAELPGKYGFVPSPQALASAMFPD
jgi:hypothetical protein